MKKVICVIMMALMVLTFSACNQNGQNPDVEVADTTEPVASALSWVTQAGSVTEALPEKIEKSNEDIAKENGLQVQENPFEGDWIGVTTFRDCTGQFAANEGAVNDIVARFVVENDGSLKAFMAIPVQTDLNFKNVMASYSDDTEALLLSGTLLGANSDGSAVVSLDEEGRAAYTLSFTDSSGDAFKLDIVMRLVGSAWSSEDVNTPTQNTVDTMGSLGIYNLAEQFSADINLIPEWD